MVEEEEEEGEMRSRKRREEGRMGVVMKASEKRRER